MKSLSNRVSVLLLIIAIGLLVYFLIALSTILSGVAIISGPIHPPYLSIEILVFVIISLVVLIIWRTKWESKKVNPGDFYKIKMGLINGINNSSELTTQRILNGSLYKSLIRYKYETKLIIIEVRSNGNLISRNRYHRVLKLWQ